MPILSHRRPLWAEEITSLARQGLYRKMRAVERAAERVLMVDGREALNFSTNNYLGLAGRVSLIEASCSHARRFGAGSTASRLIAGNGPSVRELEDFIASWKGTEAAVAFGSGYQANVGVLSSVVGEGDLIVSDALNHASIVDGCRLSRARVAVYPHRDVDRVEDYLRLGGYRRKLVVTEAMFSMDGDFAPLAELSELCERFDGILMVDEAHSMGALGPRGRGLATLVGVTPDIQLGTLGKAAGAAGAYVAGSKDLVEILVNKARSLIFTTALPPAVIGAAIEGLRIIASPEGDTLRQQLESNARLFRELLKSRLGVHSPGAHIVPFLVGDAERTMRVSARCLEEGVFAQGIRFPTVPRGAARLRFSLMSPHTAEDIETAVSALARATSQER